MSDDATRHAIGALTSAGREAWTIDTARALNAIAAFALRLRDALSQITRDEALDALMCRAVNELDKLKGQRRAQLPRGFFEVGTNGRGEVVVNHPDLQPDAHGVGHIVFSPEQARALAQTLLVKAAAAEDEP